MIKTAAGPVVLNVFPVVLVAGGVGAAVAFAAPEGDVRRKVEVA
jgi:hypothetical protein